MGLRLAGRHGRRGIIEGLTKLDRRLLGVSSLGEHSIIFKPHGS